MSDNPAEVAQDAIDSAKHLAELAKGAAEPLREIMSVQFFILLAKMEYVRDSLKGTAKP